jgi:hypothetical protein
MFDGSSIHFSQHTDVISLSLVKQSLSDVIDAENARFCAAFFFYYSDYSTTLRAGEYKDNHGGSAKIFYSVRC